MVLTATGARRSQQVVTVSGTCATATTVSRTFRTNAVFGRLDGELQRDGNGQMSTLRTSHHKTKPSTEAASAVTATATDHPSVCAARTTTTATRPERDGQRASAVTSRRGPGPLFLSLFCFVSRFSISSCTRACTRVQRTYLSSVYGHCVRIDRTAHIIHVRYTYIM